MSCTSRSAPRVTCGQKYGWVSRTWMKASGRIERDSIRIGWRRLSLPSRTGRVTTSTATPVLELTGSRTPVRVLLADLWQHRDLLAMLARQDYRSRYRSASLGLLWSIFLPLLQGLVIAIVFGKLIGGGQAKVYIPYVVTGVTSFGYLSQSLTAASTSIVDQGAIAGRIYFPRLVL